MTDKSSLISLRRKLEKEAWEIKSLTDICELIRGYSFEASDLKEEGEIPVLQISHIQQHKVDMSEMTYLQDSSKLPKNAERFIFRPEDVCLAISGSQAGKIAINQTNNVLYFRSSVCKLHIIDPEKIRSRYLFYFLTTREPKIRELALGPAIKNVQLKELRKLKVPVPPRHIQDQIVEYLDKWTSLESQLEQELKEELEQRKKQYEYYKESLLNSGMNKWEIISLDKIANEITKGKEVTKNQLETGNYPAIRYAEIFKNPIYIENCINRINPEIIKNPNYCNYGDLLISGTSENLQDSGKAIVYIGNEKPIIGSDIVLLKHEQNGKFLSYACSSEYVRSQFKKIAAGTTVIHVYKSTLKHIKIPLPSLEEQDQIVELLDKFHTITESFKDGLPSLIEKHKKQYTYYKEQILNPEITL